MNRLPSRPLYDAAAYVAGKPLHAKACRYCNNDDSEPDACLRHGQLGEMLGVSRRTIGRYQLHGIPLRLADRYAIRLGYNPIAIWGLWWDDPEYLDGVDN